MKQTLVLLNVSGHGSNSPKYCENSSALRVALMRITFRSGLVGVEEGPIYITGLYT